MKRITSQARSLVIAALAAAAAVIVLAGPAAASAGPGPAMHGRPAPHNGSATVVDPIELWVNDGHPTTFPLHAHAGGAQLSISSSVQDWDLVNPHTWRGSTVWELKLDGGGGCANYSAANNGVYYNSCVSGSHNEWWFFASNGQCTGCYQLDNAYAYDNTGFYALAAASLTDGALVWSRAPTGAGTQEWVDLSS